MKNLQILRFVVTLLAAYVAWYGLYDLWLLPDGRLDDATANAIAGSAAAALNLAGFDMYRYGTILWIEGTAGIEIVPGCNGYAVIGLFVGFVAAYPGSWNRRLAFIPAGLAVIMVVNFMRICALAVLQKYQPAAFHLLHDFFFTGLFYVVVLGLWVLWAHWGQEQTAEISEGTAATA